MHHPHAELKRETGSAGIGREHLLVSSASQPKALKAMARDNFKKTVIEDLAKRVAYLCSNPDCLAQTVGPKSDVQGAVLIGEAAHITAASPGGPRYDPSMNSDERASFSNGIWLCRSCAARVDRDVTVFPTAKLRQWKKQAEARAFMGFNRRNHSGITRVHVAPASTTISPLDALSQAGQSLSSVAAALESIDPRFKVSVFHDGSATKVKLNAAGAPVHLTARLFNDVANTTLMKQFLEFGVAANFSEGQLSFEGSKLFDEIAKEAETVTLERVIERHAVVKILVAESDGETLCPVVECPVQLCLGSKGISCQAELFGGFMVFTACADGKRLHFELTPRYERWIGHELKRLPYFDQLARLHRAGRQGFDIHIEIEVDGLRVTTARGQLPREKFSYGVVDFLRDLRLLLKDSSILVIVPEKLDVSGEDIERIRALLQLHQTKDKARFSGVLTPVSDDEVKSVEKMLKEQRPTAVRVTQPLGVRFFDGVLLDRTIAIEFPEVTLSTRQKQISVGKPVPLKFLMSKDTRVSYLVS